MSEPISVRCYVTGKVQGVFFRAGTKEKADELGVTGWVRNLEDGRVEVLACGEREKVEQFYDWLKQGPKRANVTDLKCEVVPLQQYTRFEVVN